ncbi:ArsR/SmtB family transcription factor [Microbacterium sp. B24]|uniref:ArsR/SmtB family transcription factor n=1 Tax=Microbacterium sp. B24 TaxID=95616 RepID=UPI000414FAF7|nr:metalloregulator ArsR/SmtB family transcription factor [Microbacterium sp. B24]
MLPSSSTPENGPSEDQLAAASATFDLLSVPGRLHLVWLLSRDETDVTALAARTGAQIAATSQQLAKLRAAGVVSARREGRRQLYRVDDVHIIAIVDQMLAHIAPDGTIAQAPDPRRPPRRPRFVPA